MWKLLLNFIPGVGPFLSAATSFVAAHWKFFVIAAMIGTLAYQNFSTKRFVFFLETIPHEQLVINQQKSDIAALHNALNIVVSSNQKLTTSIGALNTTVGDWEAKTTELQKQNDALQGKLNQMRTDTNKKISDILNTVTPTTCEASIDFLRTEKKDLSW